MTSSPDSRHAVGCPGRDDQRAHDDRAVHEGAEELSEVLHGAQLYLFWWPEIRLQAHPCRDRHGGTSSTERCPPVHGERCSPDRQMVQKRQQQGS